MAFSLITSWQIDGENVETVSHFIFLDSDITADSDSSHEIKKSLAPWNNSSNKPRQCIKKQTHHFDHKAPSSQSYSFFLVVMHGCESWTLKAEC